MRFINPINSKTKLEMELLLHKQNLILGPIGNIFMNLTPLPLPNPKKKGNNKNMHTCGWHLLRFKDMQCLPYHNIDFFYI